MKKMAVIISLVDVPNMPVKTIPDCYVTDEANMAKDIGELASTAVYTYGVPRYVQITMLQDAENMPNKHLGE